MFRRSAFFVFRMNRLPQQTGRHTCPECLGKGRIAVNRKGKGKRKTSKLCVACRGTGVVEGRTFSGGYMTK